MSDLERTPGLTSMKLGSQKFARSGGTHEALTGMSPRRGRISGN